MSAQNDRDQFNAALTNLVERANTDAGYRAELGGDVVGFMKAAGISESVLAELLKAEGLDDSEVQGFGLGGPTGNPGGNGIIIGTICFGTCRSRTIVVGCTRSILGGA